MAEYRPPLHVYRFGEYELSPDDRLLLRDGERVPITPRASSVLLVLVENAGRVVSKETLMNEVWADSFVEEGNLNRTVSRLRKILGEKADEARFIETIPRIGYRFVAYVEEVERGPGRRSETPQATTGPAANARNSGRSWLTLTAVAIALLALASLLVWFLSLAEIAEHSRPAKHTPLQLTTSPTREERPVFSHNGHIRFIRWEGDRPLSYVIDQNGSNARREVSVPGLRTGSWSPDGKKVIFYKEDDDRNRVFLANSDGSNEMELPFVAGNLEWSPDGTKLLYQSGISNSDIHIYDFASGRSEPVVSSPAFDADPSFSPDGRSIVFVSDRDGNAEIYFQDLDGTDLRRLTNHPAHDEFPTFSPDGTQIVFNSNREEENYDVYLMNSDGGGVRKLTNWSSEEEIRPGCWSADGTRIVLTSNRNGKSNVYVMEVEPFSPTVKLMGEMNLVFPSYSPDGMKLLFVAEADDKTGELHILDLDTQQDKTLFKGQLAEMVPRFSPDGHWIVLQSRIDGNAEIGVISVDGGEFRNLTHNPARDVQPAWSPDGSKIVFSSNRDGNYDVFQLYLMNADGSNQHPIYHSNAISNHPSWSPTGKQIIFSNDKEDGRSGNFEIFVIEPENTTPERRLTFRRRYDIMPVFSPDGTRIAFASNTDGNIEIYLMNSDGSGLLRLTRDAADDTNPNWSPDGKRIVFSSSRNGKFGVYEIVLE